MSKVSPTEINQLPNPSRACDIPIGKLLTSRYQMRIPAYESDEDLKSLAHSIKTRGLSDPIWVRPHPDEEGFYEIISGHRRVEAIKRFLKWREVKCLVYEGLPEKNVMYLVGDSNFHRHNIFPYERGVYFRTLSKFMKVGDMARLFGFTPRKIKSWLDLQQSVDRLTKSLTVEEKRMFLEKITKQKLDALLKIKDENDSMTACRMVMQGSNLLQIELFVEASLSNGSNKINGTPNAQDGEKIEKVNSTRSIASVYSKLINSEDFTDARKNAKELGQMLTTALEELDTFREIAEIKNGPTGHFEADREGILTFCHKLAPDGSILCINQIEGTKKFYIGRFKVN